MILRHFTWTTRSDGIIIYKEFITSMRNSDSLSATAKNNSSNDTVRLRSVKIYARFEPNEYFLFFLKENQVKFSDVERKRSC